MVVLGIDTALSACSAAIMDGQATMSQESVAMNAGHAEALAPMVKRCFVTAQILPTTVTRIGVTIGPGTFTGLRVGLALARGMAVALECPVVGVTTFEALAYQARTDHPGARVFVVALDARRGEIYLQAFEPSLDPLMPPSLVPLAEAVRALHEWAGTHQGPVAVSGSGSPLIREQWRQAPERLVETKLFAPDARFVARWAAEIQDPAQHPPSPLYLRSPDAKPPGERKRRPSPRIRARRG